MSEILIADVEAHALHLLEFNPTVVLHEYLDIIGGDLKVISQMPEVGQTYPMPEYTPRKWIFSDEN